MQVLFVSSPQRLLLVGLFEDILITFFEDHLRLMIVVNLHHFLRDGGRLRNQSRCGICERFFRGEQPQGEWRSILLFLHLLGSFDFDESELTHHIFLYLIFGFT
jgi:hypothetical protein